MFTVQTETKNKKQNLWNYATDRSQKFLFKQ